MSYHSRERKRERERMKRRWRRRILNEQKREGSKQSGKKGPGGKSTVSGDPVTGYARRTDSQFLLEI